MFHSILLFDGRVVVDFRKKYQWLRDIKFKVLFSGISEEESDVQDLDVVETSGNLTNLMPGVGVNGNHSDFFFGDGDIDQINFEYDELGGIQNGQVGKDENRQKFRANPL